MKKAFIRTRVEINLIVTSHHTLLVSDAWPHLPLESPEILGAPFQVIGTTILNTWWASLKWGFAAGEEGGLPSSPPVSFPSPVPVPVCDPCSAGSTLKASKKHFTFFWFSVEQNQFTKGLVIIQTCADKQQDCRARLLLLVSPIRLILVFSLSPSRTDCKIPRAVVGGLREQVVGVSELFLKVEDFSENCHTWGFCLVVACSV